MLIRGLTFEGPYRLGSRFICPCPGVYAILCRGLQGRHTILYIGESGRVNERVDSGHHKWSCFHELRGRPLIAFYVMPGSSQRERRAVERELLGRADYRPPCNG